MDSRAVKVSVCLSWVAIVHAGSGCNEAIDEARPWSCGYGSGHPHEPVLFEHSQTNTINIHKFPNQDVGMMSDMFFFQFCLLSLAP